MTGIETQSYSSTLIETPAPVLTLPPLPATAFQSRTLTTLSEVADLLDSLEAHGIVEREVILLANNQFAVRWR